MYVRKTILKPAKKIRKEPMEIQMGNKNKTSG